MKLGLHYTFKHPALRVLLTTTFVTAFAGAALVTIEVVYVKETLKGGDTGYGILLSVVGIGALLAAASAPHLTRRFSLSGVYVFAILGAGLMYFPYANIPYLGFVVLVAGLQAIPWFLSAILADSMIQRWVDDVMRGRVFSLFYTERSAGHLLIAAVFAPLIDLWGPTVMLNVSGVIYTLVGLFAISRLGVLRRVDEADEIRV